MSRTKSRSVFSWFRSNPLEEEKKEIFSTHFEDVKDDRILELSAIINRQKNTKAYKKLIKFLKEIVLDFSDGELREKVLNDWNKNDKVNHTNFYLQYKLKIATLYYHLHDSDNKKGGKSKRRPKIKKNKTKRRRR